MPQKSVKHKEIDAPFHCVDGSTINTIKELTIAIDRMSDDAFYYHVTSYKNDFAAWVSDVFHESELAKKMSEKMSKEHNLIVLLKHLCKL